MEEEGEAKAKLRVLDSVRILDFSHVLAGPYCTRLLVDLGAEAIKVEPPPPKIELSRTGGGDLWWLSNCGKKSLCLNLTKQKAVKIVHELVKQCDVVVENFRAGVMAKLRIGYDSLQEANPRIIMCSLSPFGQEGPYSHLPASALVPNALSGYMWMQGKVANPDGPPIASAFAIGDVAAAVYAAVAICSALYFREITGIGQHIDISLIDCLFAMLSDRAEHLLVNQQEGSKIIMGGSIAYAGKDGYITLGGLTQDQQVRLFKAMGREDLINNPKFDCAEHRRQNIEDLRQIITDWVKSFDSIQQVASILEKADVIFAPVLSIWQASRHPHIVAHGMVRDVDVPKRGKVKVLNTPFRFSHTESGLRGNFPRLGEHNNEILTSLLDYSAEELAQLREERIIYSELS